MSSSLGKALQRSKKSAARDNRSKYRHLIGEERYATEQEEGRLAQEAQDAREGGGGGGGGAAPAKLQSIWQTNDLQDFLAIADAREEGYFADRDVRVVVDGAVHVVRENKIVPMSDERRDWIKLSETLPVPRRPSWTYEMSPDEVQAEEKKAFVDWRRSLAQIEEQQKILMTPYERNLEVWRQLWRVVERADVVMVILDSRNPLIFRSKDFEAYVRATKSAAGAPKRVLLLLNKADLLTDAQRQAWADYFTANGDIFFFFSAMPLEGTAVAAEQSVVGKGGEASKRDNGDEKEDEDEEEEEEEPEEEEEEDSSASAAALRKLNRNKKEKTRHRKKALRAPVEVANPYELAEKRKEAKAQAHAPRPKVVKPLTEDEKARNARLAAEAAAAAMEPGAATQQPPWAVLDPVQLLDRLALLRVECGITDENTPLMVGLVGYPNVGKSSTINAIIGAKKVVVSATPGKTKHFQTLTIPNERRVGLCDCPGLVFPSFASTSAQMACDGILPADTLTDAVQSTAVVCRRLPRQVLETALNVSLLPEDDIDESHSLAERLLNAMARRRGYMADHDRPNKARAGKELLKMYVEGRFVYAEPPPSYQPTAEELALAEAGGKKAVRPTSKATATPQATAVPTTSSSSATAAAAAVTEGNAPREGEAREGDDDDSDEYEDWDSADEQAWEDLDEADEQRALSDHADHDSVDSALEVCPPMFYARPHGLRHCLTRQELFNAAANEARMAVKKVEKRKKRKVNHQLEPDEYTFINRQGEVELRIDDDDGVLQLVTATGGSPLPSSKLKPKSKRQQRRELKKMGVGPVNPSTRRVGIEDFK